MKQRSIEREREIQLSVFYSYLAWNRERYAERQTEILKNVGKTDNNKKD